MGARRSPRSVRRTLAGSLACLAVALIGATTADVAVAGVYQLHVDCTTPTGVNHLFAASSTDNANYTTSEECPTAGGRDGGIHVGETLNRAGFQFASGAHAEYTFHALPGTTIVGISYRRSFGQLGDNRVIPGLRDASGNLVRSEWCQYPNGGSTCNGGSTSIGVAPTDISGLNTTALAFGLVCVPQAPAITCLSSVSNEQAWFSVYSADIVISQATAPTLGTASGSLLDGAWQQGSQTVTLTSASDTSGIEQLGVAIDGGVAAPPSSGAAPACDFTLPKPCRDLGRTSWSVDTAPLVDGDHTATVVAQNPAGIIGSTSPVTFKVDNTVPAPPAGLSSSAGTAWQSAATTHLSWTLPDQDQGSPVSAAYTAVCDRDGLTCGPPTATPSLTSADVSVPGPGSYRLKVWLEDAAGQGPDQNVAFKYAAGPPGPPTAMNSSASGWQSSSLVDVRWTPPIRGLNEPALDHGEIEVCSLDGSNCATPQTVGIAGGRIALPREGTFLLRGWDVDEAGLGDRQHAATTAAYYSHTPPRVSLSALPARTSSRRFATTVRAERGGPAPVVGVEWTACRDGRCPLSGSTRQTVLSGVVPSRGRWTLTVTPFDAAGVRGTALHDHFTVVRLDPRIRLRSTLRSNGLHVRIAGDRRLRGRMTLRIRFRVGTLRRGLRRTVQVRAGAARAVVALPANASQVRVTGSFPGSATFRAARVGVEAARGA